MKRLCPSISLAVVIFVCSCEAREKAKYIFFFIGDGMGSAHVDVTEKAIGSQLTMTSLPIQGTATTHSANKKVTDSAAAGTALACGEKTNNAMIGQTPAGEPLQNLSEIARERGLKVGIITSVTINHATPASFYAHAKRRNHYFDIAKQLAQSDIEYVAGGGMAKQKSQDGEDALEMAKDNGFTVVRTRRDLLDLKPGGQVYAFNHRLQGGSLPYSLDYQEDDITLAEFVAEGIRLLQNDRGFFMMVEGGKIDWAGHANHLPHVVHDTLAFDKAIAVAAAFMEKYPGDTLIVVTADHETGGLHKLEGERDPASILRYTADIAKALHDKSEKLLDAGANAQACVNLINEVCGLTLTPAEIERVETAWPAIRQKRLSKSRYGSATATGALVRKILAQRAGYEFSRGGHSAEPVPVYAGGVGAEQFKGRQDNTDIPKKIIALLPETVSDVSPSPPQ